VLLIALSFLLAGPALAAEGDLTFCNKFRRRIYVAIAYPQTSVPNFVWYLSRGWLQIESDECYVFDTTLKVQIFYYHAESHPYKEGKHKVPMKWGSDKQLAISTSTTHASHQILQGAGIERCPVDLHRHLPRRPQYDELRPPARRRRESRDAPPAASEDSRPRVGDKGGPKDKAVPGKSQITLAVRHEWQHARRAGARLGVEPRVFPPARATQRAATSRRSRRDRPRSRSVRRCHRQSASNKASQMRHLPV
jgi:Protein of unknown function (DUF1036)